MVLGVFIGRSEGMTDEEMRNAHYSLVAIDCDIIAYQASAAVQKVFYCWKYTDGNRSEVFNSAKECKAFKEDAECFFGEDVGGWERETGEVVGEAQEACKIADNKIKEIMGKVKGDKYDFWMTGKNNHRIQKAKLLEYKGNRKDGPRPTHLQAVREHLTNQWGAKTPDTLEADDVLSVIGCNGYYANTSSPRTAIVTIDKDNLNSPCVLYNHREDSWAYNSEEQANFNLFVQILWGDLATDNIKGLPNTTEEIREKYNLRKSNGVGEVTAKNILKGTNDIEEMYQRVLECYHSWYGEECTFTCWKGDEHTYTAEEMLDEQANLVFLMRDKGEFWEGFKKTNKLGAEYE